MPTVVYFDDDDISAAAGETVDVEVFISSDGTFAADVAEIELVAKYDGEYLSPVEVTPGEWLEQGESTTVETETDVDEQSEQVVVHQWRDPPEGGAEGFGRFATITFAVPADTPSTEKRLTFDETSVALTDGNPMPVYANTARIHIDGLSVTLEQGDSFDLVVETPPQVSRHQGYETAFLDMPAMSLDVDE